MTKQEKMKLIRGLSEKDLTTRFLIPLFESKGMGCRSVRYTHGVLEDGRDVVYYREDEYGKRVYTGVQVKRTKIVGRNLPTVLQQLTRSFGEPFRDVADGTDKRLDRFILLTSNEFSEEAKDSLWASLKPVNLDKVVTCIDGSRLVDLIDIHMPYAFWDEYEHCNKYFAAIKAELEEVSDLSVVGRREPLPLERIYVSLKVCEPRRMPERPLDEVPEKRPMEKAPREGEIPLARETGRILEADRAVREYSRIVIVGAPGSGKTTLLRYLALKACGENLQRQERFNVPIPVNLRDLLDSKKNLRTFVGDVFARYGAAQFQETLEKDLQSGKCMLLLDGFDEVATRDATLHIAETITQFVGRYPTCRYVVSSRTAGYHDELAGFTKLELMEFDDRQIGQFIHNWFGESDPARAKSMSDAIRENESVKALARNPLMVAITATIYEEDKELPQKRADLYERCVSVLLGTWDRARQVKNRYQAHVKQFVLRKLALRAHANSRRSLEEKEILGEIDKYLEQIRIGKDEAPLLLEEIWTRSNLLRQIAAGTYDFLHLSFQEYFAALELTCREDGMDVILEHVHDPWWEEPIRLWAGIKNDATYLIRRVTKKLPEDMFYSNLLLFGKCISDAEFTEPALRTRILDDLWRLYDRGRFAPLRDSALDVLALIKPRRVEDMLIVRLASEGSDVRVSAAEALGALGSEQAIEPLMQALTTDKESYVRRSAAEALGALGSERAIEPLMQALTTDKESYVRWSAAEALGKIGGGGGVGSLQAALADKERHVRDMAFSAMRQISLKNGIRIPPEGAPRHKVRTRARSAKRR